jgi:hypothetical protein
MFAMPTYSDPVANLELDSTRSFRFNGSGNFMTGHNGVFKPRVRPFHGQAVAVADSTSGYLYKNLIALRRWIIDILNGKLTLGSCDVHCLTRPG